MERIEACKIIFDYLCLRHEEQRTDVIFVVGGSTLGPPEKAAELHRARWAPLIAFIDIGGTFGPKDGTTAELYHKKLFALGIPETTMVWAPLAHNTLEEASTAIPFLRQRGIHPRTVILVARSIHARRAWTTFQKQWPRIKFVSCPADEPFDPAETSRLLAELERLETYGKAGDLLPQEIPPEVRRACKPLANPP